MPGGSFLLPKKHHIPGRNKLFHKTHKKSCKKFDLVYNYGVFIYFILIILKGGNIYAGKKEASARRQA